MFDKDNGDIAAKATLGARISVCAKTVGGKKRLSEKTGVSEAQLYRYIGGTSKPTVEPLVKIAQASGVGIEWLATGKARKLPWEGPGGVLEINLVLLVNVIEAVEESIAKKGVDVRARQKAEFIALLYDLARKKGEGKELEREAVFRMVSAVLED